MFHTVETVKYAGSLPAQNGMDLVGPAMPMPDGTADGVANVTVITFTVEATAFLMTRGFLGTGAVAGHGILGSEGVGVQNGGAGVGAAFYPLVVSMDSFGFPTSFTWFFINTGALAGPITYQNNTYFPTLMDGFDYPINNGEQLQENLSGPQDLLPAGTTHAQEVHVKTLP